MLEPEIEKTDIGVLIVRFQVDEIHAGQHDLIKSVLARHKKVLILLGNSVTKITRNNPLDFQTRRKMVSSLYPEVEITSLKDMADDAEWSKGVDAQIRSVFDMGTVTIYGSRDSFIPHYHGQFKTAKLAPTQPEMTGKQIREMIAGEVTDHPYFRKGVIYAAYNKYPHVFPTVDIAIFNDKDEVLLGHKKVDKKDKWRFPGGFVDSTQDDDFEQAAKREAREEVGDLELGDVQYVGTTKIDDWRYRNEPDSIMTTLFVAKKTYGKAQAGDDLDEVQWFNIYSLIQSNGFQLVEEHKVLLQMLKAYLDSKNKLTNA